MNRTITLSTSLCVHTYFQTSTDFTHFTSHECKVSVDHRVQTLHPSPPVSAKGQRISALKPQCAATRSRAVFVHNLLCSWGPVVDIPRHSAPRRSRPGRGLLGAHSKSKSSCCMSQPSTIPACERHHFSNPGPSRAMINSVEASVSHFVHRHCKTHSF
jgi:hypothetical protein